jgi:hypothetical protein
VSHDIEDQITDYLFRCMYKAYKSNMNLIQALYKDSKNYILCMDQFNVSCKPTYSIIFTIRMPVIAHDNLIITFLILESWIELPLGC